MVELAPVKRLGAVLDVGHAARPPLLRNLQESWSAKPYGLRSRRPLVRVEYRALPQPSRLEQVSPALLTRFAVSGRLGPAVRSHRVCARYLTRRRHSLHRRAVNFAFAAAV